MMNTNLLDLNNDVLNIIGDYVKKDNANKIKRGDITFNEYIQLILNIKNFIYLLYKIILYYYQKIII